MNDYWLVLICGAEIILAIVLLIQQREHRKLKQAFQLMEDQLRRNNDDVAGLCAAALEIDQRIAANEIRLNSVIDLLNSEHSAAAELAVVVEDDVSEHGYERAIEKIKSGADADELVRDYGLSRDEAMLLIRLHGNRR